MTNPISKEDRARVAELIRKVLMGYICVREAILAFPKDSEDASIIAAYHALVHYEADEDLRRRDELYKEEQNDYLEFISYILKQGNDLPDNIIKNYEKYYKAACLPHENNAKGFLHSFFKFLNIEEKN